MERNPIQNDARRARRKRRRGPICLICGGPANQQHHVVGRKNDPELMADLCDRCHEAQHELLRTVGVSMARPSECREQDSQYLKGVGVFLCTLSIGCFRRAQEIEKRGKRTKHR